MKTGLRSLPSRIIDRYAGSLDRNSIEYWQNFIFYVMSFAGTVLGTFSLIASLIFLLPRGWYLPCAIFTAVYGINVLAIFFLRIPLKAKTLVVAANFYLFGVLSLILGGPVGESGIWFSVSVLFCSLFIGLGASVLFAALNFLTGIGFGFLHARGLISWEILRHLPFSSWLLQSLNIFFIDMMFAVANTVLIRGVGSTFRSLAEAEGGIRSSLAEKETLIRELYHRTKNNMQVVSSLLFLHAAELDTQASKAVFNDVIGKIGAMSLVHEKLYESKDLSNIDLADYIRDLTGLLIKSHGGDGVRVDLDLESVSMLIDTAIPCGLAITEIVTNALKYAFPGGRAGRIAIELKKNEDDTILLKIADDGVGPGEGFTFPSSGKMGMKTLNTIVSHQLHGDIECRAVAGLEYAIRFKGKLYEERVRSDGQEKESSHSRG